MRLILIRHAKSDHGQGVPDMDRVLSARGRADAPRMGRWLAARGHVPARVLCSAARRTRETLDLMLPAWSPPPQVEHRADLYHAGPEATLAALGPAEGRGPIALVGHNPTVGALAARLGAGASAHPRWGDFPTCAVAVLDFGPGEWLGDGAGEVVDFAIPADLADAGAGG